MATRHPALPAPITRVLGMLGVIGGLVFLAAFVVEIPPGWNLVRILLWQVGAIAVTLATFPPHAAVSRRIALLATVPVVVTTAAQLAWTLLSIGRPSPFSGDFGLAGFWISTAIAASTAVFGIAAWRLGVVWSVSAIALAVGSLLGYLGIDRLGLSSSGAAAIVGPVALAGLGVAALGWVLLGLEVAFPEVRGRLPGRSGPAEPVTQPAG